MRQFGFKAALLTILFILILIISLLSSPDVIYAANNGPDSEVSISNGILTVYIESKTGYDGVGTYTICTGPNHPVPSQDILQFGVDGDAWTSYNTIHVLNETIGIRGDYVTESDSSIVPYPGFSLGILDEVSPSIIKLTLTRMVIQWIMPEGLNITQDIEVLGLTAADTYARITMTVKNNNGTYSYGVGIRYLWDLKVACTDGSWLRTINPTSNWLDTEHAWYQPSFEHWEATDDPANPTLIVCGSITEPSLLSPQPTRPDNFTFATWGRTPLGLYDNAWNFTIDSNRKIAGFSDADSAVAYYWGPRTLAPGGEISVTAYIWVLTPRPVGGFIVDSAPLGDWAAGSAHWHILGLILTASCILLLAALRIFRRYKAVSRWLKAGI
ncbi:MAG: hypothetical protein QXX94_04175 [Candidatus Bathyarchaeia archaeon]